MSLKFAFGHAVYNARTNFGWTQEEVAEAIGISVSWYQKIEKGEYLPSATVMLRLIILLEINTAQSVSYTHLSLSVSRRPGNGQRKPLKQRGSERAA